MSIYTKLGKRYLHFRQRHTDIVYGRVSGHSGVSMDENSDNYEKAIKEAYSNLTEDERQEMIASLLEETDEELEDMWAEMWPGRTMDLLLIRELLEKAKA